MSAEIATILSRLRGGDFVGSADKAASLMGRPAAFWNGQLFPDIGNDPCGHRKLELRQEARQRRRVGIQDRLEKSMGAESFDGLGPALMALCELSNGKQQEALARLDRAILLKDDCFWLHYLRGFILFHGGGTPLAAFEAVNKALDLEERACAYSLRAVLNFTLRRSGRCIADARLSLALNPLDLLASKFLMEALAVDKDGGGAGREAARVLKLFPRRGVVLAWGGRIQGIIGDYPAAFKNLNRAIRLKPTCALYRAWRSEVHRRTGREHEALADLDAALALDGDCHLAYAWRGRLRHGRKEYELALSDFDRSLRLSGDELRTRGWRAGTLWKMGSFREAALEFEALHPRDPCTLWNRGFEADEVARRSPEKWKDGGDPYWHELDQAVEEHAQDAWVWAFRGYCRLSTGRRREAAEDLAEALRLDSGLDYARRWLAECK